MNRYSGERRRHRLLIASVSALTMLGLTGCVPTSTTTPGAVPSDGSAAPTSAPSSSAAASPSAGPTSHSPAPGGVSIPVSIACGTLVSPQVIYDFNPNFSLMSGFTPPAGSAASVAVSDRGIACSWVNQTSRATITVSVARPGAHELAALTTTAARGTASSGYGDAAYFSKSGDAGRIDVFSGRYWLVATSSYFASTVDASGIVKAALSAMK